MKGFLYPRLALSGIKKNFRFYLPFLFACIGMMMVFYITAFLANSNFVAHQPGGAMTSVVLRLGWIILTAFSAIFLFYTNSFLLKRRKNEFGLYNILGMSKTNVSLVLVFENLFILIITLVVGISLGVFFSKFVEILLINMLGGKNSLDFYVDWAVVGQEVVIYAMLFALILLKGVHQVSYTSPIKLFTSAKSGERPPKANIAVAVIGAVLLIAGYVLANIVKNPVFAILAFFGAVVLVIAATFLLFISGSVVVCKLLKKNKKYYYRPNHFISVSGMIYRMKQNAAGLASICILSTMVLVMLS
ncbi:MAG: FtsX-like permease family protein, partial [Oscillospiraceae bacterium]|nr:FtsX-like permease family protein [Oscillospiraceae bacterium]